MSVHSASRSNHSVTPIRMNVGDFSARIAREVNNGARLGLLTARYTSDKAHPFLIALMLYPARGEMALLESRLESSPGMYLSLTPKVTQAHWFERAIHDFFGIRAEGHPRFKSVILHEAWPKHFYPMQPSEPKVEQASLPAVELTHRKYRFLEVKGEGVYEIPVGPIHAGIIEPGHFRFSCLGEIIQNLEIRLGYQHRGIEKQLTEVPWRMTRFLAEAASSDTAAGNALAHSIAIESMYGVEPPKLAVQLRAIALEIERIASHIGDLGGICSDIGFAGGAAVFGCLRGQALGLAERLTGSRFLTAFIRPGGVAHCPSAAILRDMAEETTRLSAEFERAAPLLMDNSGALERMEGIGIVRPSLARDFGLVGPAGRASGQAYDVRDAFRQGPYRNLEWELAAGTEGDVLSRVAIRVDETRASIRLIQELLTALDEEAPVASDIPDSLPADALGVGIVEGWRGELIHLVFTDAAGKIGRYCIKDPSFNNWTGLAIAARGELVADFPLCNKSFGLSYSGNDL